MTTYPNWQWDCPMCELSIMVADEVLITLGERSADQHLDFFKETHINTHCEDFARELAGSPL